MPTKSVIAMITRTVRKSNAGLRIWFNCENTMLYRNTRAGMLDTSIVHQPDPFALASTA